jgi:dTDP-4-dehydrorhamnose reductase
MKILILGATGMLGHKLMQVLSKKFTVTGTVRPDSSVFSNHSIFSRMNIIGNIRADDLRNIQAALDHSGADVVINCIGIVKQVPAANDPLTSIFINALFPHQLARICRQKHIRLIHMSTDCVFSGHRGKYTEEDVSDAEDLYGRTKFLGELDYPDCLTIRTSIIGRELDTPHGLIEWFLGEDGKTVYGYKKVIFSGLTTIALSEIIKKIISDYPAVQGVRQIASEPISKYDLLTMVKRTYGLSIKIEPDETFRSNRSLIADKFKIETKIKIPSWEYMIDQMHRDPTPYTIIRGKHVQQ